MTALSPWIARAALAAVCLLPSNPVAAAAPKTGVVAGSGKTSGGVFTAGEAGADYVLPSQARLRLAPGAAVRIFPVPQPLQLAPGPKTTTYSFVLLQGRVDLNVPIKPRSAVLASIGKLSSVVTRGEATLLSQPSGATVANVSGDVRTLLEDRWQTLPPGTLARFGEHHGHGTPEPAIAAPTLQAGQRLWFSPGAPVLITGFAFGAVSGAHGYEVRLRSADASHEQVRLVAQGTVLRETFAPTQPGRYQIAVRTIDRDGLAGPWSSDSAVHVVGVTLPAGGYIEGGDLFVGEGQEVRFSHTEGLEMTYEGAGRYVPATQAVSLYRGELTVVSFRVPGSLDATSTRLRPRGLQAQVAIGPSRAVWPRDKVEVSVELRNSLGRAVPEWLELKPEVRLGIEPIEVAFTREGHRWVGVVPTPDKPGPWVLRVEVRDQFGALLGRDFLEIATQPSEQLAAK